MKFGIYEKALLKNDFPKSLKQAKAIGYDFWEMSIDPDKIDRLNWTSEKISEIQQMCIETDMPIFNIVLSLNRNFPLGSKDENTRNQGIEYVHKTIQLANKLGVRTIQLAGYYSLDANDMNGTLDLYIKSLREVVAMAAQYGVILAIENMDYNVIDGITMKKVITEINSPFLQAFPDVGNFEANGINAVESLKINEGHIVGIHLKETNEKVYRRVDFSKGIVNFKEIFDYLKTQNHEGYLGVEMWNDNTEESLDKITEALNYLRLQMDAD